jgi:hypothetical protein
MFMCVGSRESNQAEGELEDQESQHQGSSG